MHLYMMKKASFSPLYLYVCPSEVSARKLIFGDSLSKAAIKMGSATHAGTGHWEGVAHLWFYLALATVVAHADALGLLPST